MKSAVHVTTDGENMSAFDFSEYAQSLLDQLVDDTEKELPHSPRCTSFHSNENLDGDLRPLSHDQIDSFDP